jgi:hypothetical protein
MTPTLNSWSPRLTVRSFFCAACASSVILLRTNSSVDSFEPGVAPAGSTDSRTTVPAGPRISCTTSSSRQPTTSTSSPLLPCATAVMRSLTLIEPLTAAGPPGITFITVTWSSMSCSEAPMPT